MPHDHFAHSMGGSTLWDQPWNWNIVVLLFLILLCAAYCYAIGPLRQRSFPDQTLDIPRLTAFLSGLVIIFAAVITPLNALAMQTFTAHMLQHLLIALSAAPLLVVGLPVWLLEYIFQPVWLRKVWIWLTNPFLAALLFSGNLWLWHAPPILNTMVMSHELHLFMLTTFLVTGILFWWALIAPSLEGIPTLNLGSKLIFILLSDMPMVLMGAGFTFMPSLYSIYQESAAHWGFDLTFDQRLGGLLMWIPGSIFFIVIASIIFWQWMNEMEKRQRLQLIAELEEEQN